MTSDILEMPGLILVILAVIVCGNFIWMHCATAGSVPERNLDVGWQGNDAFGPEVPSRGRMVLVWQDIFSYEEAKGLSLLCGGAFQERRGR